MQNKTNNGSEEPISLDVSQFLGSRVAQTSSVGAVAAKWLTKDAREVRDTTDEASNILTDTACLLRVIADVVQADRAQRMSTDEEVSRAVFFAAALVDFGASAVEAQGEAAYLVWQTEERK